MEKIKALENSNKNYIKEINEIKLKNEEYKNNYEEQIEIYKNKNIKNEETYNEEINKLKKEIHLLVNSFSKNYFLIFDFFLQE